MHSEPNKFSAGLLTLAVHTLFLGVLYMSVRWQPHQPEGMEVELWSNLPVAASVAAPPPAPPQEVEQPPAPDKVDISMGHKKKTEEAEKQKASKDEKQKTKKLTEAERKKLLDEMMAQSDQADESALSENAARAELANRGAAAISSEMNKYKEMIAAKIRRNIIMPPDVREDLVTEYVIVLLPDGSLLGDPKVIKSSGNAAYDSAVGRAIIRAKVMPLPKDEQLKARFINPNQLRLRFSPSDGR